MRGEVEWSFSTLALIPAIWSLFRIAFLASSSFRKEIMTEPWIIIIIIIPFFHAMRV
jgi:hypothetical protein